MDTVQWFKLVSLLQMATLKQTLPTSSGLAHCHHRACLAMQSTWFPVAVILSLYINMISKEPCEAGWVGDEIAKLGPGTSKSQTLLALLSPHCPSGPQPQLLPCSELVQHAGYVLLSMHAVHKGLDVCSPGPCICLMECLRHVYTVSKREFSTDLNWLKSSSKNNYPRIEEELIVIGCPAVTSRIHHHFMNFKDISSFSPCNQWMWSKILLKHSVETLQPPDPGLAWSANVRTWCMIGFSNFFANSSRAREKKVQ